MPTSARASAVPDGVSSSVRLVAIHRQAADQEASGSDSHPTPSRRAGDLSTRRRTRARLVRLLLVTMALWLLAAGYLVYDAQKHARAAEDPLRRVADIGGDDLSGVDFAAVEQDLARGSEELAAGRRSITSPVVRALGPIPVIGRQLASARALITTSDDLATALTPIVAAAHVAQDEPNALDRVSFLRDTSRELAELRRVIDTADLGPANNLVGPLADARVELAERLIGLEEDAGSYEIITRGLAGFFSESSYLVLGANNAEMQIGGGMPLSVGRVEILNGDFELPGLEPSSEFFPVAPSEAVDADVEARWRRVQLTNDFRKLNYTVRFDEFGGPQALAMWEADSGERLDGVLSIDPFVLDAILGVVGAVEVEGETYAGGDALLYLLRDQYAVFDDGDDDAGDLVEERQDRLSLIASAAVEKLSTSSWDPIELIEALRPLARGRHLLAYSSRPDEQAAWTALGIDGSVSPNSTGIALINNGGAKLDPFMAVDVDASVDADDQGWSISYTIQIENQAPAEGLPRYTVGPWRNVGLESPGTYWGQVAVYVPGYATEAVFDPPVDLSASGPDGDLFLNATRPFALAPGASVTYEFRFVVPDTGMPLRLIPSSRFPATNWTWSGETFTDSVARELG